MPRRNSNNNAHNNANANNAQMLPQAQQQILDRVRAAQSRTDGWQVQQDAIRSAFDRHQIPLVMALALNPNHQIPLVMALLGLNENDHRRPYSDSLFQPFQNLAAQAWTEPGTMARIFDAYHMGVGNGMNFNLLSKVIDDLDLDPNDWDDDDHPTILNTNRARELLRRYFTEKFPNDSNQIASRLRAVQHISNNSNNNANNNNANANNALNKANNANNNADKVYKINANNNANANNVNANTFKSWALNANAEKFSTDCDNLFIHVDPMYTCFARKIAKVCESVTNPCDNQRGKNTTVKKPATHTLIIHKADSEYPADSLVKAIRDLDFTQLPTQLKNIEVTYKGLQGVGPGVARDFISGCIVQLSTELLEPASPGSDYYAVKRELDLKDMKIKRKLITFGYVILLMINNNLSFPFKIKRGIIHLMLLNTLPSQDPSYIAYQVMEDPESMDFALKMLREPNTIEGVLDFEDVGRKPKPVTKENFISYLCIWAGYIHISPGTKYVAKGLTRAGASDVLSGYDVMSIFNKLCVVSVDKSKLAKFLKDQVEFTASVPANIKTWFINVVTDADDKFVRSLLHFWSGFFTPMPNQKYQVTVGNRVVTDKVCPLPESHTCYLQLVLPKNLPSEEMLKSALEKAVAYVAKGVTMYGGKKKKTTTKAAKVAKSKV